MHNSLQYQCVSINIQFWVWNCYSDLKHFIVRCFSSLYKPCISNDCFMHALFISPINHCSASRLLPFDPPPHSKVIVVWWWQNPIDLADELCTKCVWFTLLLARMWVLKATTSLFLHRTFINVRTSVVYICDCTLQLSGGERAFLYRWVMPIVNNPYLFFYL